MLMKEEEKILIKFICIGVRYNCNFYLFCFVSVERSGEFCLRQIENIDKRKEKVEQRLLNSK